MTLANLYLLRPELDRLVCHVPTDLGRPAAVRAGDRVKFQYRDKERRGVVVGVSRGGFRMVEDGGGRPKSFSVDGVSGFAVMETG